jgi:hypothetical protein
MGTPNRTQDTSIPVGSVVRVINSGECYSTYTDMAEYMGLKAWKTQGSRHVEEDAIYTVVAKALHERRNEGELLGIQDAEGNQFLIGLAGVRLIKVAKANLASQVATLEQELEAVTAERDALKAQIEAIEAVLA